MDTLTTVAFAILGASLGAFLWWFFGKFGQDRAWMRVALPLVLIGCFAVYAMTAYRGAEDHSRLWSGLAGFMFVYVAWIGSGRFHERSRHR